MAICDACGKEISGDVQVRPVFKPAEKLPFWTGASYRNALVCDNQPCLETQLVWEGDTIKPIHEAKLVRVELEYENGKIQKLEGDEAQRWLEAANGAASMSTIHGVPFPEFDWEVFEPVDGTEKVKNRWLMKIVRERIEDMTSEQRDALERVMDIAYKDEAFTIGPEDARAVLQLLGLYTKEAFKLVGFPEDKGKMP